MYEQLQGLEHKFEIKDFPLNIGIEITNHCNLNCIMCNNDKLTRPHGYMSIKLYKKIIDEVSFKNKHTRIWLDFYGEALLARYKLYYMIDYAKKRGLTNICMCTNATLLDEEMAEMVLDSGIDYISIDCDGFSAEVYESIRIGAKRDTFYRNVEHLLHMKKEKKLEKPIIEIRALEMHENKDEIEQIISYWRGKGARTAVRRLVAWGGSRKDIKHNISGERIACGLAIGILAITWDGKVPTCSSDYDMANCMGDINIDSISNIWQRRNQVFIKKHMEHKWSDLPHICQICTDWSIIGEKRWDEYGNEIIKSYNHEEDMVKV